MRPPLARHRIATVSLLASAATLFTPTSRAADPTTVDCLSASETSLTLRKEHHFREARRQLLVCAALSCPADIRSECERRVIALNTAMPTLVFEARDAAGNDLSAVTVTMDGKPLLDRLEGTAISLDPGAHTFHFETAGATAIDKSFVLREGEKDRRERVVFGPPSPVPVPAATAATDTTSPASSNAGMSRLRILGLVGGGIGIAGIGVGTAFAAMAGSASSSQQSACASPTNCPNHAQAVSDRSTYTTDTAIAIAGFAAGGALLVAGVAMFIVGANKAEPEAAKTGLLIAPAIVTGGAGLTLVGGSE